MRTCNWVVPTFSEADWKALAAAYPVPKHEERLIRMALTAAGRGCLEEQEFREIAAWKSARPKQHHAVNTDVAVRTITATAFAVESDVEKVDELTRLSGINVRSATAILHLCFPTAYPLLDVRAMATLGLPDTETKRWDELQWLRVWKPYISLCRDLLPRSGLQTLRQLGRALWFRGTLTADQWDAMHAQRRADAESGTTV